jgi:AAA15 family ATPase/GTPase
MGKKNKPMNILERATISNYQSHKKTVLDLHHGVNVVIGLTDCGKSALFRALQWPITNRNGDKGFRSKWGGKTDVELKFSDGKEISRVQQDKDPKNAYYLFDPINGVDEEYSALKTLATPNNIPEDITQALNMSDINIQSQFDPPYLLTVSSGEVAKTLNKVANLEDIDTSISNIQKQVRENKSNIKATETNIEGLETNYAIFAYIPQMEQDIKDYEDLCSQTKGIDSLCINMDSLLHRIVDNQKELAEIDSFLRAEEPCGNALALIEQEKTVTGRIRTLESIIIGMATHAATIKEIDALLQAEPEMYAISDQINTFLDIELDIQELNQLINKTLINEGRIRTFDKNLDSYTMEFNAAMVRGCPLCGK